MRAYIKSVFSLKKITYKNVSLLSLWDSDSEFSSKSLIGKFVKLKQSKVGRYSRVNKGCTVANTEIKNFTGISFDCLIGPGGHPSTLASTALIFHKHNKIRKEWCKEINYYKGSVEIGNDVLVGARSIILNNVKIGDGAIIGAGSVVTKNVEPYSIVGGVPARHIKYRFEPEIIERLMEIEWWNFDDQEISQNINFFWEPEITLDILNKYFPKH